jgi:nucleoside-diphosphate-sugar epimerase
MKYLVTGGAGFIGTNLTKQLLREGHVVRIIDNYVGGRHKNRIQTGAEYVEGDIRNMDDLLRAMKDIDGIFHMAALPRVTYSVEEPALTHDVNVNGTLNVLLAARDSGVKRVVFSSSSSTYGDQPREMYPLKEGSVNKMPVAPYALHKLVGEHYVRLFSELYGLETLSLVYFNVYGPYCDPNGAYALVIGKFLQQRSEGEPMTVCGDGEYYRDYTHVSDVVRANILAMTKAGVANGQAINIGNNNPQSVNDIVKLIGGEYVTIEERPGDVRFTQANNDRAKKLLGWEPTISLEEGIETLKKEWEIS